MRKGVVILLITIIASAISLLFWYNDIQYRLPTPVPQGYHPVTTGAMLNLSGKLPFIHNNKPMFLHFFNPSCPCSRFNIQHFKSLVQLYGKEVNFIVVAMAGDKDMTAEKIQDTYGLAIPVVLDSTIAANCGVYSTPQAAIINTDGKLYYHGNYNKTRYCTDKRTNYAQIALEAMLKNSSLPGFDAAAGIAYGCTLPRCSK